MKILKEHIKKGLHTPDCCPAALAINDELKDGYFASVLSTNTAIFRGPDRMSLTYTNPKKLYDWICAFDTGKKVDELEFELDIPKEFLK